MASVLTSSFSGGVATGSAGLGGSAGAGVVASPSGVSAGFGVPPSVVSFFSPPAESSKNI